MLQDERRLYRVEELDSLEGEFELDEGILVPVTRPKRLHGRICMNVGGLLWSHCRATGQGEVLSNDAGFILQRGPDTLRGPDVAVIRVERARELAPDCHPEGAPDLVVEVISESNRPGEMLRKVGQYLESGATLVWVIYPERAQVVVYRSDGEVELLAQDQELTAEPVLKGFHCKVADLFL
ncbi:MAG: hypothetical protein AMXMBFR33_38620 [Candidatus Xenobia bacterium]